MHLFDGIILNPIVTIESTIIFANFIIDSIATIENILKLL
jgi:hypothetical protein